MIIVTCYPHGCFLISFLTVFSLKGEGYDINGHTGEVIRKNRWKLIYERGLRNGYRDASASFHLVFLLHQRKSVDRAT